MGGLAQTTPAWTALTAYLAGARVTRVTPDGLNWRATVGGTSGAVEPTWPTTDPWTVTDGGVTWILATSFRQMAVAGLLATLQTFKAANPWAINDITASRPRSLSNFGLPGVYIDGTDEIVVHARGVRTRTLTGFTAVLVNQAPDNDQASNYTDVLVDALMDAFTAAYHAIDGSSILELSSVTEVPIDESGMNYLGTVFTFSPTSKAEGRT